MELARQTSRTLAELDAGGPPRAISALELDYWVALAQVEREEEEKRAAQAAAEAKKKRRPTRGMGQKGA